ncbi:hypothetical protein BASA61_008387 [Batrachochytrium salamandrivorans]|nr:hypothetical protein BASA61_008387 [Batrachochytrium salamandrivorans]
MHFCGVSATSANVIPVSAKPTRSPSALNDFSAVGESTVSVDNPRHCDFSKLRYMLLNSHLQDLKEVTPDILYEQYRTENLASKEDGPAEADAALRSHESSIKREYAQRMEGV